MTKDELKKRIGEICDIAAIYNVDHVADWSHTSDGRKTEGRHHYMKIDVRDESDRKTVAINLGGDPGHTDVPLTKVFSDFAPETKYFGLHATNDREQVLYLKLPKGDMTALLDEAERKAKQIAITGLTAMLHNRLDFSNPADHAMLDQALRAIGFHAGQAHHAADTNISLRQGRARPKGLQHGSDSGGRAHG